MNPNTSAPGFELPTPQSSEGSEALPGNTEQIPAFGPEGMPKPPAASPVPPMPPSSGAPLMPIAPASDPAAAMTANPVIADDNDLIEKEWVQKAKQIVAATKDDPYTQNREISRFKADYLKKRYNKDIKLEDS